MTRSRLLSRLSPRDGVVALRFVLVAYVLFSVFDWVTTTAALAAGGREGNPIAASIFSSYGDAGLLVFKVVVVAVIVAVLLRIPRRVMSVRVATWVGAVFAVWAAIAVIHNVQAYSSLQERLSVPAVHGVVSAQHFIQ